MLLVRTSSGNHASKILLVFLDPSSPPLTEQKGKLQGLDLEDSLTSHAASISWILHTEGGLHTVHTLLMSGISVTGVCKRFWIGEDFACVSVCQLSAAHWLRV